MEHPGCCNHKFPPKRDDLEIITTITGGSSYGIGQQSRWHTSSAALWRNALYLERSRPFASSPSEPCSASKF